MNNCSFDIEVNGAVPVHGVEYEGGFPLEIEVQCGHELLSIPADEPQSEVCLIEGGIVPDGMEVEWEQVMETGGIDMAFAYVGPALADIDFVWSTDAWFLSDGWFEDEGW